MCLLEEILTACGTSITAMSSVLFSEGNMLTCTNHGDGRLYVNPLVCINARVDKDKTVKVGLLYSTQRILNGVVILRKSGANIIDTMYTPTIYGGPLGVEGRCLH